MSTPLNFLFLKFCIILIGIIVQKEEITIYRIEEVKDGRTIKVHFVFSNKEIANEEYSNLIKTFQFPNGTTSNLSDIKLIENGKVIHSTKVITPLF